MSEGQNIDRATLATASKLLAKAEATPYEPEAAALIERSYRLLAGVLNAFDEAESSGGERRRERRQLHDRRASRKQPVLRTVGRADAAATYRQRSAPAAPAASGDVNLTA